MIPVPNTISVMNSHVAPLLHHHYQMLAQVDRPSNMRTLTARNYDSSIKAAIEYLHGEMPTKANLEKWRDDMKDGIIKQPSGETYSISAIKARLSAMRKLLNSVADSTTDLQVKFVLRDWATVADPKAVVIQDMIEEDYGLRLSLESVQGLMDSIPKDNIKGLRDRLIVGLGVGAGLRISEVVNLTVKDLMETQKNGQRGIHVRNSKHGKTRVVVVDTWSSWIFRIAQDFLSLRGILPSDYKVIVGVKPIKHGYTTYGKCLSATNAAQIYSGENAYTAEYQGQMVSIASHDMRRTYAYLCKKAGMSWEALSANLGHSSILVTQRYVGFDVDWSERVPLWSLNV